MSDSANLAARLLAFARTTELADALLTVADLSDGPVPMGHEPSPQLGARVAKRGVKPALTVAGAPLHDPQLLAQLARMPQKTIRRLVAANPNTPHQVLEQLRDWALREDDAETLDALTGTLPPPAYLPVLATRRDAADRSVSYVSGTGPLLDTKRVVANLARRGDAAMTRATFALDLPAVRRALVVAAAYGRLPVGAADLIGSVPYAEQATLLDALLFDGAVPLSAELVGLIAERLTNDTLLPERYRDRARESRLLTPEAVGAFLRSGVDELHCSLARSVAACRADVDDEQLDELSRTTDDRAAAALLHQAQVCDRLTAEQLARLAFYVEDADTVLRVLQRKGADLSPGVVVDLLRGGNADVTAKWLTGRLPAPPTREQIDALVTTPGTALDQPDGRISAAVRGVVGQPTTAAQFVDLFLGRITVDHLDNPGVSGVLDVGGPYTLRRAARNPERPQQRNTCAEYIGARFTEAFGDDVTAWTTAVKLVDTATVGTVSDLITVVTATLNAPR